jgi:hypothetical protein
MGRYYCDAKRTVEDSTELSIFRLYDWALLSDMDNSGRVDFADFSYLAGYYGEEGEKLSGDLNRNGKVDLEDISLIAADWLKSTDWAIGW